jgi:predicted ester cyclase
VTRGSAEVSLPVGWSPIARIGQDNTESLRCGCATVASALALCVPETVDPSVVARGPTLERDTARLLRLVTEEIWCRRRNELVDELISDDFVDHVEIPQLEGTGRARYLASVVLLHNAFSDYHEKIELIVADEDHAVSYARSTGTHDGNLMGLPPTRRRVDFRSMGILRFANRKVVEVIADP